MTLEDWNNTIKQPKQLPTLGKFSDDIEKELNEANEKVEETKKYIWEREFNFLCFILNKCNNNQTFVEYIEKIQKENWLSVDWVVWPQTLKFIYENLYSRINTENPDYLPSYIKIRLEIYNEMKLYYKHPRENHRKYWTINPDTIPPIFNRWYYFGDLGTENIKWTFIDKDLVRLATEEAPIKEWNHAYLKKVTIDWKKKHVVTLYINWKLELASYSSPWKRNPKKPRDWNLTPKNKGREFVSEIDKSDMYHISWSKNTIKREKWSWIWPIMPYSVMILSEIWIYAHAWNVNWERRSHWCVRLPLFYAKWMYELNQKHWDINWHILDN